MKTYVLGLCANRHVMPVKDSVYPQWVPHSCTMDELEKMANSGIPADCDRLALYATGLGVALMSVVKVCLKRNIKLTVYHYDPYRDEYNRQEVL